MGKGEKRIMTDVLQYLAQKYGINTSQRKQPVEIPNTGRDTLATIFREVGFTKGAEVGVERGIYSEILLQANPDLQLYSIDCWEAYEGYRDHMTQEEMDLLYEQAKARLGLYHPRCIVIKGFSTEVAKDITDESLDFVYLDGNHEFVEVVNDIAAWEKKVKVGGIIAGHDYIKRRNAQYLMQVPYAIHGYVDAYTIKPLFILGRRDKIKGELRDSTRSWFYVKPKRGEMIPGWKPKT